MTPHSTLLLIAVWLFFGYAPLARVAEPSPQQEEDLPDQDRSFRDYDQRTGLEIVRFSHMSVPFGHTFAGTEDPSDPDWGFFGAGLTISGPTFRWEHFYLSATDFAVFFRPETGLMGMMGGVRAGYPLFLDPEGRHEIDLGLGLEFGTMNYSAGGDYARLGGGLGLILNPSIGYSFATDKSVVIGSSIRAFIITPASGGFEGWVIVVGCGLDVAFR